MKNKIIKFPRPKQYKPLPPAQQKKLRAKIKKAIASGKWDLAPTNSINKVDDAVLEEFFKNVLKMDYYDCLVTDMSSLHDFPENYEIYVARIKRKYKKDFSKDKNLRIFEVVRKIFGD